MNEQKTKKVTRRDALEIMSVAAAVTMVTLPSEWRKPQLTAGKLPVHAQTSPSGSECVGNAFTVKITHTGNDGVIKYFTNGDWNSPGILKAGESYLVQYPCYGDGCWEYDVNGTVELEVTTFAYPSPVKRSVGVGEWASVLIDSDSGEYSFDRPTTPTGTSGCVWSSLPS